MLDDDFANSEESIAHDSFVIRDDRHERDLAIFRFSGVLCR